ncbi:DUF4190 domain-containing protein [Streptomyces sp. QH1-20]|uniref:DUF4190 domain-containing protein n=1 Tax=Streptomyces sp. QH1-20 TaxID=3240934 RepID=UPI0035174AFA
MSGHQQNPYSGPQSPPAPQGYAYPVAPPLQPYGQPGGHSGNAMPTQPRNGLGIAGLVCGIVGAVCGLTFVLWFLAFVLGVLAIVFGAVGRSRVAQGEADNGGAATAGLVLGITALVLPLLWFALIGTLLRDLGPIQLLVAN